MKDGKKDGRKEGGKVVFLYIYHRSEGRNKSTKEGYLPKAVLNYTNEGRTDYTKEGRKD